MSSLPFFVIMFTNPTYTNKQFWLSIIVSGLCIGVIMILTHSYLLYFFGMENSYWHSLLYILPLLLLSIAVALFKHLFVWESFSFKSAFLMTFMIGLLYSIILSLFMLFSYNIFNFLDMRFSLDILSYNNEDITLQNNELTKQLLSPAATSLSMLVVNIILDLVYSLIIATFAKQNKSV